MTTLRTTQNDSVDQYVRMLYDSCVKTQHLELLPTALLDYDFSNIASVRSSAWGKEIVLEFSLMYTHPTQADVDSLKKLLGKNFGIAFHKVSHQYDEDFRYEGEMIDDVPEGYTVRVYIDNAPKPEKCILTKTYETRQVEVYKASCSDTGEEM
jgi:hypothetical protein